MVEGPTQSLADLPFQMWWSVHDKQLKGKLLWPLKIRNNVSKELSSGEHSALDLTGDHVHPFFLWKHLKYR